GCALLPKRGSPASHRRHDRLAKLVPRVCLHPNRPPAIEVNRPYLATAARRRNTHPTPPKNKLTIQNRGFFVSAEIAAMAIAIWNMVTPRANTSCLWKFDFAAASLCSASDLISDSSS